VARALTEPIATAKKSNEEAIESAKRASVERETNAVVAAKILEQDKIKNAHLAEQSRLDAIADARRAGEEREAKAAVDADILEKDKFNKENLERIELSTAVRIEQAKVDRIVAAPPIYPSHRSLKIMPTLFVVIPIERSTSLLRPTNALRQSRVDTTG
jgi:hypothetical protein